MTIGQRVRHARILRKMTQKQLAQRVGIKQSSISTLETAKNPRTRYLVKIAIVLRVRAEWLESGTGEMEWSEGLGDAVASINQAMQGMSPRSLDLLLRYVAALSDEDDPT